MKIIKALWEDKEQTAMTVWFSNEQFENVPYGIYLNSPDESLIYQQIVEKYKKGEFVPEPYVQPDIEPAVMATDIRMERGSLLRETDYLMMPDYPVSDADRETVKAYRQALRDITRQAGFPLEVVWPEKPEVIR